MLAPWYRLVEDGDRLLLEHGRSVVVLEGRAVRVFLPVLLPLLDGTRTVDEIVARLGEAARPALDLALELLGTNGLLVEGPAPAPGAPASALGLAAHYGVSPAVAAERLRLAAIGIAGTSKTAEVLARLLHAAGVGAVSRLAWDDTGEVDLAIVVPASVESPLVSSWNRLALRRGTRWLGVRPFDGLIGTVGPLVVPGESACHECLLHRFAAHVDYGRDLIRIEGTPPAAGELAPLDSIAAGVAAQLALGWVAGLDTTLPGVIHVLEVRPALSVTSHPILRVPRCPACSTAEELAPPLPWHEAEPAAA
ncbi:MAG TPA: TOMM precursor leader peptide-binding protein [Gaiellaceae bacterium]|nr:TOMM precursor leader peptide-binding protein [Gaiellaceae bacterium]